MGSPVFAAPDGVVTPESSVPTRTRRPNGLIIVGSAILFVMVIIAIVGPMFFTAAADTLDTTNGRQPPSLAHLFGTDGFGRDVFARTIVSTRLTLLLTLGAGLISIAGGTLLGMLVWMLGPRTRAVILQVNAVAVALPSMILALIVAAILGPGSMSAMLAVGIANVPTFIRLTAALSASVARKDYVVNARLFGVPPGRMVVRHVLPNIATPLAVIAANSLAFTLVELSSLSFIGLGVQAPEYDYGKVLNDGLAEIGAQPWAVIGPSMFIMLLGLGIILLGDGIAAQVDPRVGGAARAFRRGQRRGVVRLLTGEAPEASERSDVDMAVSVRELTIATTAGKTLIDGVSFDIRAGEILGVVGESGSGKSLTAMSVAALAPHELDVAGRSVRVGDHELTRLTDTTAMASTVSLVYQDPMATFSPLHSIGTQLSEVRRTHAGLSHRQAREELGAAFARVSITDPEKRLDQYPHQLSGGMLQRSLIASALLTQPRLLIADEPTTALDVTVQADILRKLYRFREDTGAAVLFISHDLGVVEAICDRVLVMYRGEIVEELTADQLRTHEVSHPYTQRLLAASLTFEEAAAPRVPSAEGEES